MTVEVKKDILGFCTTMAQVCRIMIGLGPKVQKSVGSFWATINVLWTEFSTKRNLFQLVSNIRANEGKHLNYKGE